MSQQKSGYTHSASDKALDAAAEAEKAPTEDAVTEANMHVKRKD